MGARGNHSCYLMAQMWLPTAQWCEFRSRGSKLTLFGNATIFMRNSLRNGNSALALIYRYGAVNSNISSKEIERIVTSFIQQWLSIVHTKRSQCKKIKSNYKTCNELNWQLAAKHILTRCKQTSNDEVLFSFHWEFKYGSTQPHYYGDGNFIWQNCVCKTYGSKILFNCCLRYNWKDWK